MQAYVIWFIAAFALVGAELLAGTFYLLVVGLGLAAGGVGDLLGLGFGLQIMVAAVVAVAGMFLLRGTHVGALLRRGKTRGRPSLDIGQSVQVIERRADGSLRVDYRGTQWDAEAEGPLPEGQPGNMGTLYIRAMRGNTLIVAAQPA